MVNAMQCLLFLICFAVVSLVSGYHRFDVPHLTVQDGQALEFAKQGKGNKMLVAFYFPACSACRELQPAYEQVAAQLRADDPKNWPGGMEPEILAVDCANGIDGDFCRPHTIGFPTIRYFESSDWIVQQLTSNTGDAVEEQSSASTGKLLSYDEDLIPLGNDKNVWAGSIMMFLKKAMDRHGAEGGPESEL